MSVAASVGSERNLLDETPEHARQLVISNPILLDEELERLRQVDHVTFRSETLDTTWPVAEGPAGLEAALDELCREADEALAGGANILILSDRRVGPMRAPIPSLLAVASVHHHLVRAGTRLQAGLVVESGEPRSVHSVAVLVGYGARGRQPVRDAGDAHGARRGRRAAARDERGGRAGAGGQGHRQGPPENALQDGDLDHPVLLRRADLRGGRPRLGRRREALHGHRVADRRHRARGARRGGAGAPRPCLAGERRRPPAGRGPLRLAAGRRAPRLEPGHDRAPPARGPERQPRHVRGVLARGQRREHAPADAARPARLPLPRGRRHPARRGRAGARRS